MRQTTVLRPLTGLLLAVALLAACADTGAGDGEAAGGTSPTTAPETVPTVPTTSPPTPTTAPGSPGKSQITATGILRDGVEAGCVLLQSEQGAVYLLVGGDRGKLTGGRVQVTGVLAPDLLSICQEGQPLLVSSIKPVP
jgi:Protein of unknown function (DUF5818)